MHLTRLSPTVLKDLLGNASIRTVPAMLTDIDNKNPTTIKSFREHRRGSSRTDRIIDSLTLCNLFRYATLKHKLFALIGLAAALIAGAITPLALLFMSSLIDLFVADHFNNNRRIVNGSHISYEKLLENSPIGRYLTEDFATSSQFVIISLLSCVCGLFVMNGLLEFLLSQAGAKQAFRIRLIFMESVLSQEQKWIQANINETFVRERLQDLDSIEEGLGSKLGLLVSNSCTLVVGTLIAFGTNWILFLLMLSPLPVFLLLVTLIGQRVAYHRGIEGDQLHIAAFTASEAIHNIRAVVAFGAEDKEVAKFRRRLDNSQRHAYRKLVWASASSSLIWCFLYTSYALAFWYGICHQLAYEKQEMLTSHVLCPVFNFALALLSATKLVSYGQTFRRARAAAKRIFALADSVCLSNSEPKGDTECQCRVLVDGRDIRSYNVGWLRSRLAVVRQDPVLFAATIAENIRYGNPMIQQGDIEQAAIAAQAHKFILKLPRKYDTVLSPCGAPLSLGQRQLLCIARAIARNASIVILENPSHNLRGDAAAMVLHAMENAMEGRTSVLISNRAFKLRDHERIVVLQEGKIVEEGSYAELMASKKVFAQHLKKDIQDMKELGISPLGLSKILRNNTCANHWWHVVCAQWLQRSSRRLEALSESDGQNGIPREHRRILQELNKPDLSCSVRCSGEVFPPASSVLDRQIYSLVEQDPTSEHNEGFNQQAHLEAQYSNAEFFSLLQEHVPTVAVGCIFAALSGVSLSLYGVVFGDTLYSFLLVHDTLALNEFGTIQCVNLVILGLLTTVVAFSHSCSFTLVGERVGSQLLKTAYETILRQPISWFDNPKNEVTEVIQIILNDVAQVKLLVGPLLTLMFQGFSSFICWIVLVSCFYWKLGVCALSFAPAILIAVFCEHYVLGSQTQRAQDDKSRSLAMDIINKISTVKSLHQEQVFCAAYAISVSESAQKGTNVSTRNGILYGVSQAIPLLSYSIIFLIACSAIDDQQLQDFSEIFKLTESILFGVLLLAQSLAVFAPNFSRARHGAAFVLALKNNLSTLYAVGKKFVDENKEVCDGIISFHDVQFRYSTCKYIFTQEQLVLKGVSFNAVPNEMIAVTGELGSGKRACLELLQLFDVPTAGEIVRTPYEIPPRLLDNKPILSLDVSWVRKQMAIINIEPHFFFDTIWANVAYGQSSQQVTNQMVIAACKRSKVHDFVMHLPQGYQTFICHSGGQSEAIGPAEKILLSMARALLREPRIILVDQTGWQTVPDEKLKVIIGALEDIRQNRTCVVISPTLTTAENCQQIYLLQQGRVIDQGKHHELLTRRPRYRRLFKDLRDRKQDGDALHSRSDSLRSDLSTPSYPQSVVHSRAMTSQRRDSVCVSLNAVDPSELAKRLDTVMKEKKTKAYADLATAELDADKTRAPQPPTESRENLGPEITNPQNSVELKRQATARLKKRPPCIVISMKNDPLLNDEDDASSDEGSPTPETSRKRVETMLRVGMTQSCDDPPAELEIDDEPQLGVKIKTHRKADQPREMIKRQSQKRIHEERLAIRAPTTQKSTEESNESELWVPESAPTNKTQ